MSTEPLTEISRLTTALHANRCHPDFSYLVCPRKGGIMEMMASTGKVLIHLDASGWERCPEAELSLHGGDECWRRRVVENVPP